MASTSLSSTESPVFDGSATNMLPSATPAFSPLYQQIKGLILNSLRIGEWKPGEAIPTEPELALREEIEDAFLQVYFFRAFLLLLSD